ncbi:MAG: YihA family ribosome biogenesis GTP-binding protein [Lachnospiraceae bacterium]|nr:YihA family ribosome biogenesis GTP-binding protein [Lachnospiraceae bacterium]
MVIHTVNLDTVCGITSKLPDTKYPEFAFAGKSNVGKSTLINGLMNRKSYARTSSQPGKTQTINYYNINNELYLVDLPGYGYATAGVKVKEQWGRMIENYLHNSRQLRAVLLLVDIRHEPSENDAMMYDWILQAGFHPYVIATKADKIKRSQLVKQQKMIAQALSAKSRLSQEVTIKVIPWSGETKAGRDEIYEILDGFLSEQGGTENHGGEN